MNMWWIIAAGYIAFSVLFFVFWAGCHRDDEDEYEYEYVNTREPGEFGDGVTVRREP